MKICPFCKKENFLNEDNCERCNQSIQNINHEKFQIQDHILKTFSIVAAYIVFLKGLVFLESAAPPNAPIFLFQIISITATSAIIIVLLSTIYSAYQYDNPRGQNKTSGHFFTYLFFNAVFILGIIAFAALPDKNGITLLPSLLLFIAVPVSVIALENLTICKKNKITSWALVLSAWCFEIFLIGFFSVIIFEKFSLSPMLWWGIEIAFFSLLFLFFGIFTGGIVELSRNPPYRPFDIVNCLFYSYPEDILLEFFLYGMIYVALISPAIWRVILYLAS
jgi:hypothetical protein